MIHGVCVWSVGAEWFLLELVLVVRKFCMMGPQRPCGSSANASRIVFASRRSSMIWSPGIVLADGVLVSTSVLSRLYFSRSLFWRCRLAVGNGR